MPTYTVIALDRDNCEIAVSKGETTIREARRACRNFASDREFIAAGAVKVEVWDERGEVVFDVFCR